MPIKVLVISNYGDYQVARPEAEVFIGLAKMGFQISVMSYKNSRYGKEFEAAGIHVIDFHPEKKLDKSEIRRIREFLIEKEIDIMQLFNSKAIINGIQAAKGLPVKVVLYRGYTGHIHWYDPTAYFKYLHPRVDKIVCNSIGVQELINRQLFFDKRKTVTINKGHKLEWYKEYKPVDIRKELNIPADALLLVNVANNRRMKGIPYLLKAMNHLPAEAAIHLLLIGKDMDTPQNIKIIEKGNKRNNIHLLGYRTDVLNIEAACDIFVLSSIKGESITKSVLEAMSLGVTPIISDIPGNIELVVDNESGLVFPSKDSKALSRAILKLYNDRELCKRLGQNARLRIANVLNHENTLQKTKSLFEELANK
jgi:glycosyltransferase involved in cell wall biosynthesis